MGQKAINIHYSYFIFQVERYEMVIAEEPVRLVQEVTFDNTQGLRIVDVPKHRHLMKTRHVTDLLDGRLSLQVVEELEVCYIGKPWHHLNPNLEKEALGNFTQQFNEIHLFSSKQAVHKRFIFLPGAHITHDELPAKLRPFCNSTFRVQTFRYIEEKETKYTETGDVLVRDPEIKANYKNGDFIMTEDDNLPDGLNISHGQRFKRQSPDYNGCLNMDAHGQLHRSPSCPWVRTECKGCKLDHIYQLCVPNTGSVYRGCEYIILCPTVGQGGERCILHLESQVFRCDKCCAVDDCGDRMRQCSSAITSEDTTTRKLFMRMNIKKEDNTESSVYASVPATLRITYKGKKCTTNALASSLPTATRTHTVRLENRSGLGTCWNQVDISSGQDDMKIELLLPMNSPISVSKVVVVDAKDPFRCWTAKWRKELNNQQTGQYVTGENNPGFDDECDNY